MDTKEAKVFLEEHGVDNVRVAVIDLNGTARGKRLPVKKFLSACDHGMNFCSGNYTLLVNSDVIPELPTIGFSTGFPDMVAWPDLNTLTLIPWEERTAWVVGDMRQPDGSEVPFDPRTLLKAQIDKMAEKQLRALVSLEYEFYVFKETSESLRGKKWSDLQPFYHGPGCYDQIRSNKSRFFMEEIWRLLPQAGVPLDSWQVEMGGGMFEFPIKEADPLIAADRALLFKLAVKEICHQHGLLATFMAKISHEHEGLSGAIHLSVVDKEGNNLFHDPNRPHGLSELFSQWCEGLLQNLLDLTLIFLPTYNSYKRPLPGSFVGNSTTWSIESRATTLRIINLHPEATRIENRLPGSDGNPYFVIAAHLAAGLYGAANKLKLRPPFTEGNPAFLDREDIEYIPMSFEKAIERFRASPRMVEFFGRDFCQTFVAHREHELNTIRPLVADWEREFYLENA